MKTNKNIKLSEGADPLESNLNEILICRKPDGKSFIAKLVEIHGDELYFQIRSGRIIMNRRDSLIEIQRYEPEYFRSSSSEAVV